MLTSMMMLFVASAHAIGGTRVTMEGGAAASSSAGWLKQGRCGAKAIQLMVMLKKSPAQLAKLEVRSRGTAFSLHHHPPLPLPPPPPPPPPPLPL